MRQCSARRFAARLREGMRPSMKFSLKTFLIVVCVVGAVAGVMGKLLLEDPESFVTVWMLGMTVGPFVLAILTIAVVAVRIKKRGLVVWSIVLLLLPFTSFFMRALFLSSGNPVQLLTTRRLIEYRLPKQIEDYRPWQELDRRLKNKSLSREDVEDAIVALTEHMKATRPAGWNQPLSWQHNFVDAAVQGKLISKEEWINLCDAFFGTQPKVTPIAPIPAGLRSVHVHIEYGGPWA